MAVWDLAAGPDGTVWVLGSDIVTAGTESKEPTQWVARFDGSTWVVGDEGVEGWWGSAIGFAPDGTVVLNRFGRGLAVVDGTSWTYRLDGLSLEAISIAPDGTVWATTGSQLLRLPADTLP